MEIKRIFLIGFMGSGKSTLGRRLKSELHWDFIDLDDYFENRYQSSIKQYFADFGEEAFREAEQQILREVSVKGKVVIATGGGTPCHFNNMELINSCGLSIYIKLSVDTLADRLSKARQVRPLIMGMSGAALKDYIHNTLMQRELYYNQASIVVDGDVLGVDGFVRIIKASGTLMD
ncbi:MULTISPECIES: shikimate kinase [unclassified Carboxylicivirga]|uniref:shikimate kinase n=1 Tax=Carboxylicivirga TaxID=1628153 RepID=UPI003D345A62